MNREEAIARANTKWWVGKTPKEIVDFQLYEPLLCMDFAAYQKALEQVLGRGVWTHEFADIKGLQAEYEGKRAPETNPLESASRILHDLGRDDLIENTIVVLAPRKE